MKDPNHAWNDSDVIHSKQQQCGCHITQEIFNLCVRGKDIKKSADSWHHLYNTQKDTPIDAAIIRAHLHSFEIHRKAYIKHLETGKDWVL